MYNNTDAIYNVTAATCSCEGNNEECNSQINANCKIKRDHSINFVITWSLLIRKSYRQLSAH